MSNKTKIQEMLFQLEDLEYRAFHSKLIPTVDPAAIIGVRTPELRKLAKQVAKMPEANAFLKSLPHKYYEENNLHGFLLEEIKDYDTCIAALEEFLPYVDNWATCDMMSPKVLKKHLPELLKVIEGWLASGRTYTVRFGIGMLMRFYLDDAFDLAYPGVVFRDRIGKAVRKGSPVYREQKVGRMDAQQGDSKVRGKQSDYEGAKRVFENTESAMNTHAR